MSYQTDNSAPPQISVITVVFSSAAHLEQCIQSVRAQNRVEYEHIVIDGGSTDGSVELIRRYADGLVSWVSEPDGGIGDAMNKGIARAQGEWLLFLHADDYLLSAESLAFCAQSLARSSADIVCFPIHLGLPGQFRERRPRGGDFWLNLKTGIWHQASFIRRSLFKRLGGYDATLCIAMDYEFFLRAWRAEAIFENINHPAPTFMRATGLSSKRDWDSLLQRFNEERTIHDRYASTPGLRLLYYMYWPAYLSYRWVRWRLSTDA
jgi:glycosyltransferase involved in cell wall biosynthesis